MTTDFDPSTFTARLGALSRSADRLSGVVGGLDPAALEAQSYDTEWSVAQVLSHLGSAGVIFRHGLDVALGAKDADEGFAQATWDEWNAKSPTAMAADCLAVDRALLDRLGSLTDSERATVKLPLGPVELDLAGMAGMRLNEHALHTWDVEVSFDPTVTVPADTVPLVVDNLALITSFVAQPTGTEHTVRIETSDPGRRFVLDIGLERASLTPAEGADAAGAADIELPAEALVRLVYGRLDPDHTPAVTGAEHLDELRRVFPGF